ncbi:pyridoxamine 5'-phosphate oxidase family protein [Hyphobacterium sp.]|uniref:pyridoxamine 5'-phosphate oxidase family protein n=1 Tax=Hyphobacterium sp. TaxID=2004662 RepID=UPI0037487B22
MTHTKPKTDRARLRRGHHLGSYDRETVNAILDSGYLAHIGHQHEGSAIVTPMLYWREGGYVYWHGSQASRAMKSVVGNEVCLAVTHFDGLVLAKSAFHHSANYRSVMLYGRPEVVLDPDAKLESLRTFMEQLFPGRWDKLRPVKDQELKGTLIVRMAIDECAAKIRTGPPTVADEDQNVPVWVGVIPLRHQFGTAVTHSVGGEDFDIPQSVQRHIGRSI